MCSANWVVSLIWTTARPGLFGGEIPRPSWPSWIWRKSAHQKVPPGCQIAAGYFFFGAADGDGPASVLYRPCDTPPLATLKPPPPAKGQRLIFKERRVQLRPALSLSETAELPEDLGEMPVAFASQVLGFDMDRPQHRIMGHYEAIQNGDLLLYSALYQAGIPFDEQLKLLKAGAIPDHIAEQAQDWRLLLQVDYDEDLGIMFGDGARIYFFVREQDARAYDFSKVMTFSQGY
jgi:hypothetical protein